MRFRFGAIAIALLLVFVAAGCGKKKSAAVTTAAAPPATTTSASSNTTPTTTTDNTTTSGSSTSSGKPTFSSVKNCLQLKSLGEKASAAVRAAATSGSSSDIAKEVAAEKELAAAAPAEIRPDLETLVGLFEAAAAELKKVHFTPGQAPTAKQIAALQSLGKSFTSAKYKAAATHLESWAATHCGG
jgi:hypothetical protein